MANNANAVKVRRFRRTVWEHYRTRGRDLPWRPPSLKLRRGIAQNPYAVLVSEIMLQQTQVSRVLLKYPAFLKRFPSFWTLARARSADVLHEWQGLGYNRRALALKKIAEAVLRGHKGKLPRDRAALEALPGIGPGTSGSLLAFAYNLPEPFIETNIRRAFLHEFFPDRRNVRDAEILPLVKRSLDRENPREWYYALMDYGNMLAAQASENANRRSKHYRRQSPFKGSNRELRGKILKLLLMRKPLTKAVISRTLREPPSRVEQVLVVLAHEGFIKKEGRSYSTVC